MKEIEDEILEKIKSANWEMYLKILEFIKQNWYNSLEEVYNNWYKISYKTETTKTNDWYRITLTPFLEKIIYD